MPISFRFLRRISPLFDRALDASLARSAGFRRLYANPRDYRLNKVLFRRIWRLIKPYWWRPGAIGSWLTYLVLFGFASCVTLSFTWRTLVSADLTNAIISRNPGRTWPLVFIFGLASVGMMASNYAVNFFSQRLQIHWRNWLTNYMVDRFLDRRTYYDIELFEDLDNPDQRIQEDIDGFTTTVTSMPVQIGIQIGNIIASGFILANITPGLLWFVVVFAIAQSIGTLLIYIPTIRQNFESTVAEADLRYGVLHVRENAEIVAFYHGEEAERVQIDDRLATAIRKRRVIIDYQALVSLVLTGFQYVWAIGPYLLLIPLFFDHQIQYGAITAAILAGSGVVNALGLLGTFVPSLTAMAPKAIRVAEIMERFDSLELRRRDRRETIELLEKPYVELSDVTLRTPGGEQGLVSGLNLSLREGERLLIVGQTGVGKSSMLRAMAGLWSRGNGQIGMPPAGQCLFLPQRPYMVLGDLRAQLLYPHGDDHQISEDVLADILREVRLDKLLGLHGGLNGARDWGKVLSLGEQQRMGFARVLAMHPCIAFLDEATSAVDVDTERHLYSLLQRTGIAYVSVGHRPSLMAYHDRALELFPGGKWRVVRIDEIDAERAAAAPFLAGNSRI